MRLREALIHQAPSLTLQRAASDEIARLDKVVTNLRAVLIRLQEDLDDRDFELMRARLRSAIDNPEL
jgi:hypothetical protein